MNTINKKLISASILILTLVLTLSSIAYAKPFTDSFRGGLLELNNFFSNEGYKPFAKAIDFFFFWLLFTAIYMMGAKYAFKEVKRPEQTIVILLGLMTGFLMVLAGFSATLLLPYLHWFLYALLFIFYWWLLKGIKSKFWRFVLALLLTLLTIFLLPLLLGLTDTETEGVFKPFFEGFKRIEFEGLRGPPGIPDNLRDLFGPPTVTSIEPGVVTPGVTPKEIPKPTPEKPFPWWILILLLLLAALAGSGYFGYKNRENIKGWLKGWFGRRGEEGAAEERIMIQNIISELVRIIGLKKNILDKIKDIIDKKKSNITDLYDRYHKVLKYDKAFWLDPASDPFKQFIGQDDDIKRLLKLEFELEDLLKELMDEENKLIGVGFKRGKRHQWIKVLLERDKEKFKELIEEINRIEKETPLLFWEKVKDIILQRLTTYLQGVEQWYRDEISKILSSFTSLFIFHDGKYPGLCERVRRNIGHYFLIGKDETEREKRWRKLIKKENLEKWVRSKSKWKGIENINPDSIRYHFMKEEIFFNNHFKPSVLKEMQYMYLLVRYLKYLESKREKFTQMQELSVEYVDPYSDNIITLTKEQAVDPRYHIPRGEWIRVHTRLATGEGPFKLICLIDGKSTVGKKVAKTEDYPILEFTSNEFGDLDEGQHTIIFYLVSPVPKGQAPT